MRPHRTLQKMGCRREQQDAFGVNEICPGVYWYAVYDGHGRSKAMAVDLSKRVPACLQQVLGETTTWTDEEHMRQLFESVFRLVDVEMFNVFSGQNGLGSTACGVLHIPDAHQIYTVNLGDSRAVVLEQCKDDDDDDTWQCVLQTIDHTPNLDEECERIRDRGGRVAYAFAGASTLRVNGLLAVSRSFGDWDMEFGPREWGATKEYPTALAWDMGIVSKVPTVTALNTENRRLLLLIASDGLWDTMGAADVARVLANEQHFEGMMDRFIGQVWSLYNPDDNATCVWVDLSSNADAALPAQSELSEH